MTEKPENQTTEEITESRNTEDKRNISHTENPDIGKSTDTYKSVNNDETLHHSSRDRDESEDIRPGSDTDIGQSPNTDEPVDNSDETDDEAAEQPETPQDDPALKKARKDAAKYRERLRETEAQLETLESGLDMARRQVLWDHHHNLLNGYVIGGNKYSIIPSAVNDVFGDNVAQFFDPNTGALNQNAYKQHLQTMMEHKPHLFATNTELTQMELDSKVKTMIQETGRGRDKFENAVMSKPTY